MKHLESDLQIACVKWFRLQYGNKLLFAIPNGEKRNVITATILKRQGVLSGIPDLFLAEPNKIYSGLFIEMKSDKGKLTRNQTDMIFMLKQNNYDVAVCNSFESFKGAVEDYIRNN